MKHDNLLNMEQLIVKVTPTISANSAYQSGDQVGGITVISEAAFDTDRVVKLTSLLLLDREQQDAALVLYFFDDLPTVVSVDNGAFDITDAEIMAKCVGVVTIGTSDYADCDEVAFVQKQPNLLMKSVHTSELRKSGNLYCVMSTTSTPTYTSTSSLKLVLGFEK